MPTPTQYAALNTILNREQLSQWRHAIAYPESGQQNGYPRTLLEIWARKPNSKPNRPYGIVRLIQDGVFEAQCQHRTAKYTATGRTFIPTVTALIRHMTAHGMQAITAPRK